MAGKKAAATPIGPKRVENRRARFDYAIDDSVEAGMVLLGSEVKSLFLGKAALSDAYCQIIDGELWLRNMDIEPYEKASVFQHERRRDRKLLLHRKQIEEFDRQSKVKGFSILPLAVYFKNGRAKAEIGLGRGKAEYDKRKTIAEKDTRREVERARQGRF
jgi:SsrA-binding protein